MVLCQKSASLHLNHDFTKFLARPRIPRSINIIFLSQCDTAEILKIIGELDSNKASNMNISVLKSCSTILVSHLVNFFNKFLDDGIFPIILKTGLKIKTPIFKKGDPRQFENYRPVSTFHTTYFW